MPKHYLFTIYLSLIFSVFDLNAQSLNLNFEEVENNYPIGWTHFGSNNLLIKSDSSIVQNGSKSVFIENRELKDEWLAMSLKLPHNYKGKKIKLLGYIKTENVENGYAGLWMRIDPELGFDNMQDRGIVGTTDWKEYAIELELDPNNTKGVFIGGLLVGTGRMWLDNLQVTIDGKDILNEDIEIVEEKFFPADLDKEFDAGSNIVFPELDETKIRDLELLGHIWGFLKYYHPEVGKGNYNWDYELFRVLPVYMRIQSTEERNKILEDWIAKYGEISKSKKIDATQKNSILKPDLDWINVFEMNEELKRSLLHIYENRFKGDHYYVGMDKNVGNPIFKHENDYRNLQLPDAGFRLLTLYKFWNMVEYFSPYKNLTDRKWSEVLKPHIAPLINAETKLEFELSVLKLIGEMNDSHTNLWQGTESIQEFRGNNYAPFKVEFVENKLVVVDYYNSDFAKETNIKLGDVIRSINGKSVDLIVDSLKSFYPASNHSAFLRDVSEDLLRSNEHKLYLTIISGGNTKEIEVPLHSNEVLNKYRWYKVSETEKCYKTLENNIGYVTLANIEEADIPEIKKRFKTANGIIVDIRNYPSTFVPFALGEYFSSKKIDFVKFTSGNTSNAGEFSFTKPISINGKKNGFKGKVVVLVNEDSQSQAEYTAMAFKAAGATIVGSQTAGADGNISSISLPGGLKTYISGIGVFYPDGTSTQRIGIVPDIVVKPTIQGIIDGKDEVLSTAIKFVLGN